MGWLAQRSEEIRRKQRVVPLPRQPVEVQVMGRGTLDVLHARNVSLNGIGIYVEHGFDGLDLSEPVELIVTLPGTTPFLAVGEIRHLTDGRGSSEARHFGLEFTALADSARNAIERYIESRLQDGERA